jgi:hypothetical protein
VKLLRVRSVWAAVKTSGVTISSSSRANSSSVNDVVKLLELLAEIRFQRCAVADVLPVAVLQLLEFRDQLSFENALGQCHLGTLSVVTIHRQKAFG